MRTVLPSSICLRLLRAHEFGGCWVPVFDPAAEAKSSEVFWPVGMSQANLFCVVCTPQQPHPQVRQGLGGLI